MHSPTNSDKYTNNKNTVNDVKLFKYLGNHKDTEVFIHDLAFHDHFTIIGKL